MSGILGRLLAWLRGTGKKAESTPHEEPESVEWPEAPGHTPTHVEQALHQEPVEETEEPDEVTFAEAAGLQTENEVEA